MSKFSELNVNKKPEESTSKFSQLNTNTVGSSKFSQLGTTDEVKTKYASPDTIRETAISRIINNANAQAKSTTDPKYESLKSNTDYADLSKYVSTYNDQYKNVNGGFLDPTYDAINRNKAAQVELANQQLGNVEGTFNVQRYNNLTDDEISNYNYLYATEGKDKALEYANSLDLNRRQYEATETAVKNATSESDLARVAMSALSIPLNAAGSFSGINQFIDSLDGEMDPYASYNLYSSVPNTIREQVSEDIVKTANANGKTGAFASMLYQTSMSILDNVFRNLVFMGGVSGKQIQANFNVAVEGAKAMKRAEAISLLAMSGGAFSQTVQENLQKGYSQEEAMLRGAVAGAAEFLSEKLPFDKFLADNAKTVIGGLLGQALAEGGEEVASDLANWLYDWYVSDQYGHANEIQQRAGEIQVEAVKNGSEISEEDALKQARNEKIQDVIMSFLGGFISGGVMGGVAATANTINDISTGKTIKASSEYQANPSQYTQNLIDYAKESGGNEQLQYTANKAEAQLNKKGEASNRVLGSLESNALSQYVTNQNGGAVVDYALKEILNNGELSDQTLNYIASDSNALNSLGVDESDFTAINKSKANAALKALASQLQSEYQADNNISRASNDTAETDDFAEYQKLQPNINFALASNPISNNDAISEANRQIKPNAKGSLDDVNLINEDGTIAKEAKNSTNARMSNAERSYYGINENQNKAYGSQYQTLSNETTKIAKQILSQKGIAVLDKYSDRHQGSSIEYTSDIMTYYRAGRRGVSMADTGYQLYGELNAQEAMDAWRAGYDEYVANKESTDTQFESGKKSIEDVQIFKESDIEEKRPGAYVDSKVQNYDESKLKDLDAIAKALGLKVVVTKDVLTYNAKIEGGIISINESVSDPAGWVFNHEITHRMQDLAPEEYKLYRDYLEDYINKHGFFGEYDNTKDAIKGYQRKYGGISKSKALDEIAADFGGYMVDNPNEFSNLVDEDIDASRGLLRSFKQLLDKLRGKTQTSHLEQLYEDRQRVYNAWQKAYDAAVKNTLGATLKNETTIEINGQDVASSDGNGHTSFSLKQYEDSGKEVLQNYLDSLVEDNELSQEDADDIVKQMDAIYKVCNKYRNKYASFGKWSDAEIVRNLYGDPAFSVVKANGEYAMNLDFSLVCKKRRTLDAVFHELIKSGAFEKFDMGMQSIVKINDIIREHGFETACALCFVDSKRYRQANVAGVFTDMYNNMVRSLVPKGAGYDINSFNYGENQTVKTYKNAIDTMSDDKLDFTKIDHLLEVGKTRTVPYKIAKYLKENPSARKLCARGDFMESVGFSNLKAKNPDLLSLYNSKKGTGGPKAAQQDVQYQNEILSNKKFNVEDAYKVGGVRIQSFSDYIARLVFDYVQMIGDLSAKQLPAHAYTKEALFVKQFGLTGIKINMSLVPDVVEGGVAPGLDKNGDYVWRDGQSFASDVNVKGSGNTGYKLAIEIQKAKGYTKNCGTIAVGVSDEHIRKLMADPNIRMIIPYHKSSLNHTIAVLTNVSKFEDYTNYQNTRYRSTGKAINASDNTFDWYPQGFREGSITMKDIERMYLDWCTENNFIPVFDQFLTTTKKGNKYYYEPIEGYYKVLEDFTCYDEDGNFVPQGAVTMTFPTKNDAFGSMANLIEEGLKEDDILEGRRDKELPSIIKDIENVLPEFEASIKSTRHSLKDSRGNFLSPAQQEFFKDSKVVDKDGNLQVMYHGTENEFYTFDINKGGKNGRALGYGFYLTSNNNTASSYGNRIIESYVNITKPLSNEKVTMTKSEFSKFVKALQEYELNRWKHEGLTWQDSFMSNYINTYEYSSKSAALNDFVNIVWNGNNYNDVDLVFEVAMADGINDNPQGSRVLYDVLTSSIGYDGLIQGDVAVAFNSNQIKEVTNTNPTLNDDIRYSIKDQEYLNLAKDPTANKAELQRMVDEAAKNAGYTYKGYHGTNATFTVFDKSKLGSKNFMASSAYMGFFASKSKATAESYTGLNSMDTVFLSEESQAAMEKIKTQYNFDAAAAEYDRARREFETEYKKSHNYNEEVTIPLQTLKDNAKKLSTSDKSIGEEFIKSVKSSLEYSWNKEYLNDMNSAFEQSNDAKQYHDLEAEIYKEWEKGEIKRRGYTPNVKELYIKLQNPFVYDFNKEGRDADSFAARIQFAKDNGYDGCIFKNVQDGADFDDIYVAFENTQFKLADPVTYNDQGNVIPLSERFNESNEDIRYSIKDSEGNTLSKAQQEFFKNSKVRDEDGNLRVMYHGTRSNKPFTVFKTSIQDNGNNIGSHFGSQIAANVFADGYNEDIYKVYLNITNPFDTIDWFGGDDTYPVVAILELYDSVINSKKYDQSIKSEVKALTDEIVGLDPYFQEMFDEMKKPDGDILDFADIYWVLTDQNGGYDYRRSDILYSDIRKILEILGYDGISYENDQEDEGQVDYIAFYPEQIKLVNNQNPTTNEDIRYSVKVTDKEVLNSLNEQLKTGQVTEVYRAMQVVVINGEERLVPPMAGKIAEKQPNGKNKWIWQNPSTIGEWEQSTAITDFNEALKQGIITPTTYEDGRPGYKFKLKKGGKGLTDVPANYAPYIHTSLSTLNDQFLSAYKRDNLRVVRGYVPNSEVYGENLYQAPYAEKAVGRTQWHSGIVAAQMPETREVILSRYFMPVEIMKDSDVAKKIKAQMQGRDIEIPYNVVSPSLRRELENIGVRIGEAQGLAKAPLKNSVRYSIKTEDEFKNRFENGLKGEYNPNDIVTAKELADNIYDYESVSILEMIAYQLDGEVVDFYDLFDADSIALRNDLKERLEELDPNTPFNLNSEWYANEIDNSRYSMKGQSDSWAIALENEKLKAKLQDFNKAKKDLKKAQKDAAYWKGQTEVTTTFTPNAIDIKNLTKDIISQYGSKLKSAELNKALTDLGTYIMNGDEGNVIWEDVKEWSDKIASDVIDNMLVLANDDNEVARSVLNYLKKTAIRVSAQTQSNIADYKNWKKEYRGKLKISDEGSAIDSTYRELQDLYGIGMFPEEIINEADQLLHMAALTDELEEHYVPMLTGDEAKNAKEFLSQDIVNRLVSDEIRQTNPTYADKMEKEVAKAKIKGAEKNQRLRDRMNTKLEKEVAKAKASGDARYQQLRDRMNKRIEELKQSNQLYKEKTRERLTKKDYLEKIEKHTKQLQTKILNASDKNHIPQELQDTVIALLQVVNTESTFDFNADGTHTAKGEGIPTRRTRAFQDLRHVLDKIKGGEDLIIDPDLEYIIDEIIDYADTPIKSMSVDQLENIWNVIKAVESAVATSNKLFKMNKYAQLSEYVNKLYSDNKGRTFRDFNTQGIGKTLGGIRQLTTIDMMASQAYMHQMGKYGDELFKMLRKAQDAQTMYVKEASEVTAETLKGVNTQDLEKELHTFNLSNGSLTMSTAQIMNLYLLMNRDQAREHILVGGILPSTVKGNDVWAIDRASKINVSSDDIIKIINTLTQEQRDIANKLQKTLQILNEYGNEASMEVYGYEKFTDPKYWAIKVDKHEVSTNITETTGVGSIPGKGMAKRLVPHANNAVLVGSVFDVYATSVNDMVTYAAWLAPMYDLMRVYNYNNKETGVNTKAMIKSIFGRQGEPYFTKLVADLNRSAGLDDPAISFGKFTSNMKVAAVAANVRVIIQQPTAILRAMAEIDSKYLMKGIAEKGDWNKVLEYSPIAVWKDWGNFDINTGRQMRDIIMGTDSKLDKAKQWLMEGAGKADSFAWSRLWNAVEYETQDLRPDLHVGSDEYYQYVANRFADIVDKTQVVDGILQRSQIMRSTDQLKKMSSAFMSEPTKIYNMVLNAIYDYQNTTDKTIAKTKLSKTIGALLASFFVNAIAQSVIDALRDDDKDQDYFEKFIEAFLGITDDTTAKDVITSNFVSNFVPFSYVPYLKDIYSMTQGYSIERTDLSSIEDVIKSFGYAINAVANGSGSKTTANAIANLIAQTSKLFGLPVATVKRDLESLVQTIAHESGSYTTEYYLNKALYNTNATTNKKMFYDILYNAYVNDKAAYKIIYRDMLKNGFKAETIQQQLQKRIKENK